MTDNPRKKRPVKTAKDITKKSKPAEETLEQSERKYKALIDTTGTGYVILDSNGKVLDANPEYVRLTGHKSLDEIAGRSVVEWTAPHHRGKNIIEVKKCIEKGFVRNLEIEYIDQTGHITPVEINATFIESNEGPHILTLVRDITERKRADETLKESVERYRKLYTLTPAMLHSIDRKGHLLSVSEEWLRKMGYTREEVIGRKSIEFLTEESGRYATEVILPEYFLTGICTDVPYQMVTKDGQVMDVLLSATAERDASDTVIRSLAVIEDITERKQAEETLKEREKELQIQAHNLEEANVALKVLLKRRDEDKTDLEDKVLLNIKGLVTPYLDKLKMSGLDKSQKDYLTILESGLNQITSPFLHRLSYSFANFTPTEIQVANLLKQGKTSKEIGELLNSSSRTIAFHSDNIRKKLGLKNKKTNLKSYLLSIK